jgi:hypothetical protein
MGIIFVGENGLDFIPMGQQRPDADASDIMVG